MNCKRRTLSLVFVGIAYTVWWYVSVSQNISNARVRGIEPIAYYMTTAIGVNYMKAQALFVAFYGVLRYIWDQDYTTLVISRMSRKRYTLYIVRDVLVSAILYAGCMIVIQGVLAYWTQPVSYLNQYQYGTSLLQLFFVLILFYFFFGMLYEVLSILVNQQIVSFFFYFMIGVAMIFPALYRFQPTAYLMLDIIQTGIREINISKFRLCIGIHLCWSVVGIIVLYCLIRRKDFLERIRG